MDFSEALKFSGQLVYSPDGKMVASVRRREGESEREKEGEGKREREKGGEGKKKRNK